MSNDKARGRDIREIRDDIDALDKELLTLLGERRKRSIEAAKAKEVEPDSVSRQKPRTRASGGPHSARPKAGAGLSLRHQRLPGRCRRFDPGSAGVLPGKSQRRYGRHPCRVPGHRRLLQPSRRTGIFLAKGREHILPGVLPIQRRRRCSREGEGRARHSPDREHDIGRDQRRLRPVAPRAALDRRGGQVQSRALPARLAGREPFKYPNHLLPPANGAPVQ